MPHYKDLQNNLHFLDSAEHANLLPPGCLEITDAEADAIRAEQQAALAATTYDRDALRAAAYRAESDPLFFQYQRGEATQDDWLAKVDEIRARYP